jgi:uncharacterized YccA/Bax inhibitor family protein
VANPVLTRGFENNGVTRGISAGNTYGNFAMPQSSRAVAESSNTMTIQGTVNKSAILLGLAMSTGCVSLYLAANQSPLSMPLTVGGMIVAMVLGIILCFAPKASPFLAPLFALAKGLAIGGFSVWIASQGKAGKAFDLGLISVALLITFGVFGGLLAAYSFRFIRVGPTMMKMVFAGTLGIALIGLVTMGLSLFGVNVSWLWKLYAVDGTGGLIGIGFSIFCIVMAAFNLVISFQVIEEGVQMGAPKYMEWYGAYGLLVEVIWLYVEILRLLAKLRNR